MRFRLVEKIEQRERRSSQVQYVQKQLNDRKNTAKNEIELQSGSNQKSAAQKICKLNNSLRAN